jgi:hypothetical protein
LVVDSVLTPTLQSHPVRCPCALPAVEITLIRRLQHCAQRCKQAACTCCHLIRIA